ncbi:MAG: hypothetical protein IJV04_03300, partial [Lachnospiraceae bacterium]|nr:hypothetical protein [Lachnospiraceae bacterium]
MVLLAVFSGWIIYLDKSGRKGWNGRFGEETLSGDAAVFENRTKNDELENIKNTENKKGKRKNKPGLYKDPVDLKATYPVIEADGGIDFYPEHFMTCIGTWGFGSYSYMEEDAVNYMNGLN